ncbi:kinase-like domain-containing protein [Xylaria cf. heliscus]|nr:kinase-like domain-containing protein [Xylaria cf. heliscus]
MHSPKIELEIYGHCEVFVGENPDDLVYDHSTVILRRGDEEYFYADCLEKLSVDEIDISKLNIIRIPGEHIWPLANPRLTQAPEPLPATCYWKRPTLLDYEGIDSQHHYIPTAILHEAEACEILSKHPHPNIARYLGCIVKDGKIKGLGFDKYPVTLSKILEDKTPFNKGSCIRGIEAGVQHMHSLGLVHNDLKPANIMMDGDNPIIIDFDSCKPEGEKLLKGGTYEWSTEESYSKQSNDHYSLSKIREAILKKSQELEGDQKSKGAQKDLHGEDGGEELEGREVRER